jgi:streptogrisin C
MIRSRKTVATVAALAATAFAATAGAASAAEQPADEQKAHLRAAISAYQTVYPKITLEAAEAAALGQEDRKQLYHLLSEKDGGKTFAGAWFDPPTGITHIATTSGESAEGAQQLGKELGLEVEPQLVKESFTELEQRLAALKKRPDELGRTALSYGGIDVQRNAVVVAVGRAGLDTFKAAAEEAGVELVLRSGGKVEQDAGCTARNACDWTIRGGSMLWRGSAGNNVCSVGFTARTAANTRYTYTAGHCSSGNGVTWGTGGISIGPMSSSRNSGAVDAAIIQVTNPWFMFDSGGELYNQFAAGKSVAVNYVAPSLSYIWSGDTVCLAANYTQPTGHSFCGVVGTNSDASVRGMVRVDGLDACGGDSGGGWYWLTSTGRRIAYGIHSRSNTGCHGDQGGSRSWFSALPTVKSTYTPSLNVETR